MGRSKLSTVVREGPAARHRLRALGLDEELLVEVVEQGERARAEATDHDPVNAGALDAYRYRVRGLRDSFVPHEWTVARVGGLELLRSACGRRAIATRAGDGGVGIRRSHPQPLRNFGETTANAVSTNESLALDPDWFNVASMVGKPDFEIWMLLVHRDGDRVRAELSHPSGVDDRGRVLRWLERIILPELDFSNSGQRDDVPNEPVEIDVPVTRKR
jgi:hypothetical protein